MIILLMASLITGAAIMRLIARPVYQPILVSVYRFNLYFKKRGTSW
jgi:hypothetical protein